MKPSNSVCLLALAGALAALLLSPAAAQTPEPQIEQGSAEAEVPRFQSRTDRERELLFGAHPEEARLLETIEGEVLALYLPPLTSSPKGALLLTYTGEHPSDCPPAWDNLRKALPHYGWGTMVVALPAATPAAVPPRPLPPPEDPEEASSQDQDAQAESNQAPAPDRNNERASLPSNPAIPRAQRIVSRLDAAMSQLEQEGQLNLVVMVDNLSAVAAVEHLKPDLQLAETNENNGLDRGQSPLSGPVRALILANIHDHSPLSNQDLAQTFSMAQLPILDLFLGPEAAREAQRHKGQSQRQKVLSYQALTLPYPHPVNANEQQSFWIKRLEGFMSRQAKGREKRRDGFTNL